VLGGLPNVPRERQPRPVREPRVAKLKAPTKWETYAELIEAFYQRALELARVPEPDEFARLGDLRDAVGLPTTVFNRLVRERGSADLERARELRRRDLSVYLALNLFERRKSFGHLPEATRRDIKVIWGNYATAQTEAQRLLFSVGKVDVVHAACREAAAAGLGFLDGEHNLQVHASLHPALPAPLRVYLGCASRLYGEVDSADIVKVHIQSGKLSLMTFDDFESKALPRLVERVKIDMRKQDIAFFEYGSERPQNLYMKSRFMHPSMEHYEAQRSFDQSLRDTDFFDFEGFGPSVADFEAKLEIEGLVVKGFELKKRRKC
jgi:DNA phosphorothioation-associated putative methyltransferase